MRVLMMFPLKDSRLFLNVVHKFKGRYRCFLFFAVHRLVHGPQLGDQPIGFGPTIH